jgi:hypothetical protein
MEDQKDTSTGRHGKTVQFLLAEWRLAMFETKDSNGKSIDLSRTFQPTPKILSIVFKVGFLGFSIYTMAADIADEVNPSHWLIYLTHWSEVFSVLYFLFSLASMFTTVSNDPLNFVTKFHWALYATMIHAELFVTILYYGLVYKGEKLDFPQIAKHGILVGIIGIDGLILNRIPLRLKQVVFPFSYEIIYLGWTIIHAISGIGNPNLEDSDAIYEILDWNTNPKAATIVAVSIIVVVIPTFFLLFWFLSLVIPRRYLTEEENDDDKDVEEQKVFGDNVE